MTPEGRVKKRVKRLLESYGKSVYTHWPVLNGMGKPTLDCIGCVNGAYFAVETKAPGEVMTERQGITRRDMEAAGGTVFAIDGDEIVLAELRAWIELKLYGRGGGSNVRR
jgi:hypothetical protein